MTVSRRLHCWTVLKNGILEASCGLCALTWIRSISPSHVWGQAVKTWLVQHGALQGSTTCWTACYQPWTLHPVTSLLWKMVFHGFVTSQLDYCNSLLYSAADGVLQRLMSAENKHCLAGNWYKKMWLYYIALPSSPLAANQGLRAVQGSNWPS